MLVALTGTPGTGKSSVGRVLEARGYVVVDLDELARTEGLVVGRDRKRGSDEIDVDALSHRIPTAAKVVFLRGHYSHLMDVNVAVVLRCRPSILRRRLQARGWSEEKIRENMEAEAIDVITQEAIARIPFVYEIDTSAKDPGETATSVLQILQGKTRGFEAGSVDWSHEVLSWF